MFSPLDTMLANATELDSGVNQSDHVSRLAQNLGQTIDTNLTNVS